MQKDLRAYSMIEVKAVETDGGRRTFKGWATTPSTDRVGDTIDPMGAKFANPISLLHQHRHDSPVGTTIFGKPTAKGIPFEADIPVVTREGLVKDRVDMAWDELTHNLVRAVSIGFRPIKYAYKDDGGIEFQEIEIYELSLVSVPANAEATITAIKAIDHRTRAALGLTRKGVVYLDPAIVGRSAPGASGTSKVRLPGAVYLNS